VANRNAEWIICPIFIFEVRCPLNPSRSGIDGIWAGELTKRSPPFPVDGVHPNTRGDIERQRTISGLSTGLPHFQ